MNKQQIINKTAKYAKEKLSGEKTGHDWWHTERVWKTAIQLAKKEKADLFIIELAALLHDIADWKLNHGDDEIGPKLAGQWLKKLKVEKKVISHVCQIVKATYYDIDFKNNGLKNILKSKEAKIVWDADKLDALGAIGISRTFAYGGSINREIYNPEIKQELFKTFKQYKKSKGTSINHFYEKLLRLKNLMNTKAAKKIAYKRHKFIKNYLDKFFKEWRGKDLY